ncbi:MAG: type sorting protein, partial [Chitinophagaceae bacterium]|nr:type sorting protein [Chitinophagaceae bacterium]
CFSQVLSNNGAVVNITSGIILIGGGLNNASGTITNTGTIILTSDCTNSATINGAGDYNIGGNWVNTGTFTQGAGMVTFNGTGAQSIGSTTFNNVTFSGGNTKTITGDLNIIETINLGSSTTLTLSSNIILKSTSTATARVTAIPATAAVTYSTGKFIVERYIQGRRKYRLITSSVTTSASGTLTTGQESLSIWGNWQNQGSSAANIGTIITGGSSANGFDQQTTNASLYTYNEAGRAYTGFTTANGKNTKYTPLKAGIAYYMFVYGDRTNSAGTNTPNYTVLSAGGTILTGDQTYNTATTIPLTNTVGNYTILGNPFASPIDWATVTKTNISNTYWGWDPNLSSTGGYVTVSTTGSVTLISPFTGTTGLDQYIQSGQGFFVRTTASSPVLTIKESDKVSNYNANAFRTTSAQNNIPLIAINLYDNASKLLMDGTLAAFSKSFSNEVKNEDAQKIAGSAEVIAVGVGNELLSIDARQMPQKTDTIFLKVSKLTKPQYTLQIFTHAMDTASAQPYLEDTYLHTVQTLSTNDTNRIVFNVTSDAASSGVNRFRILFSASTALPISVTPVKPEMKVFPNPIKNQQVNFKINELEKGEYTITISNQQGQQTLNNTITHPGGSLNKIIYLDKKLPGGIYYLQVANKSKQYTKSILIE